MGTHTGQRDGRSISHGSRHFNAPRKKVQNMLRIKNQQELLLSVTGLPWERRKAFKRRSDGRFDAVLSRKEAG
jgi:hypothetical protein